jgi:hypothetical protein
MRASLLLPLSLCACVSSPRPEAPDPLAPTFSPLTFFVGRTEGVGTLRIPLSSPKSVRVHGSGHMTTLERHLVDRQTYKERRSAAWSKWQNAWPEARPAKPQLRQPQTSSH